MSIYINPARRIGMQYRNLIIVGAGGFAREVLQLVEDINQRDSRWEVIGFIDEDAGKKGNIINGYPILGGFEWFLEGAENIDVAFAVGNPQVRKRLVDKFRQSFNAAYPNLIHPSVKLSKFVDIGIGNIICQSVILTTNITLGDFNILNLNSTVGHDTNIGSFCTIAPGVNISGHAALNDGCDLGTNSCIIQGKTVGEWSIIGAGSVIVKDIGPRCTAVGVPAKVIKYHVQEGNL